MKFIAIFVIVLVALMAGMALSLAERACRGVSWMLKTLTGMAEAGSNLEDRIALHDKTLTELKQEAVERKAWQEAVSVALKRKADQQCYEHGQPGERLN